jgi:hypothetical protein
MYSFYGSTGFSAGLPLSATDESLDDDSDPGLALRQTLSSIEPGCVCGCGCLRIAENSGDAEECEED